MSSIWPVSDCDQPVQATLVTDYHNNNVPCGIIAVQAAGYSARWEHTRPEVVCVRAADGSGGVDWLEWSLDASLLDGASQPVLGLPTGASKLAPEFKTSQAHQGETVRLTWIRPFERGELRANLIFAPEAIRASVTFVAEGLCRLTQVHIGQNSRVWADHALDYNPDTSGTFYRPLHALRRTGTNWLSPAPFARAFHQPDGRWSCAAVECRVEKLEFSDFFALGSADGSLSFALDYPSQPDAVILPDGRGEFTTPELVWRFGFADEFAALQGHVDGLIAAGLAERVVRETPAWHARPMTCGWHRQVELATQLKDPGVKPEHLAQLGFATGAARSQDFARQDVYEDHLAAYEKAGIDIGTIVIDHGWSITEGDWRPDPVKWPDLPGFVRAQHAKGRRVLLWVCVQSRGLPDDEIVRNAEGPWPTALDPRHPKWRERVDLRLREMLGTDGIGADGLKLDFTGPLRNPSRWIGTAAGHSTILHGYQWLIEFYRAVGTAALAVRPDALLDFQCAHPQFAPFHGMTRLNDFFLPQAQALRVMETRARIAKIASQGALIDTDCPAGLAYLRGSTRFGNQSLYLTHAQLTDPAIVAAIKAAP
jgi:hypothetical protein